MTKHILIDSSFGLVRTAISQDGKLMDYYEESPDQGRSKGNIYKGMVKKVDAHIQAAFVRYGSGRDGFLPLRDVPFRSKAGGENGSGAVGPGHSLLVQVVKDEVGGKGAALTTKLALSGRYLVYMPGKGGDSGISSRLSEEERSAMKKAMAALKIPPGGSVILRTAALGTPASELQADLDRLEESYREIKEQAAAREEPGLVYREAPPALRYLREYYTPDVERIWVNSGDVLEECRQFFHLYEPKAAAKVVFSAEGPAMFRKLGIEPEVEKLSARKVVLPSGANFVIDETEALVAIDVNSAKSRAEGAAPAKAEKGEEGEGAEGGDEEQGAGGHGRRAHKDLEDVVFAINMEAGAEIARQLRLRDLGGIIIVDFIDMEEESHRRKLEDAMRRALAADKAKVKVFDISPLGLMQISRQRLRKAGPHFSKATCEACLGRGWHVSPAVSALSVLRRIDEKLQGRKPGSSLTLSAPYPVANMLLNEFRSHMLALEQRRACQIRVLALPSHAGDSVFTAVPAEGEGMGRMSHGKGKEKEKKKEQEAAAARKQPSDRRGRRGSAKAEAGPVPPSTRLPGGRAKPAQAMEAEAPVRVPEEPIVAVLAAGADSGAGEADALTLARRARRGRDPRKVPEPEEDGRNRPRAGLPTGSRIENRNHPGGEAARGEAALSDRRGNRDSKSLGEGGTRPARGQRQPGPAMKSAKAAAHEPQGRPPPAPPVRKAVEVKEPENGRPRRRSRRRSRGGRGGGGGGGSAPPTRSQPIAY